MKKNNLGKRIKNDSKSEVSKFSQFGSLEKFFFFFEKVVFGGVSYERIWVRVFQVKVIVNVKVLRWE